MKVVTPAENLKVVSVGHESLGNLVYLLRLLRLPSPLAEDHIAFNVESGLAVHVAFHAHQAGLLGMLEIVAMALGNLPIDSLLHPSNFIDQLVSECLHHLNGKAVLRVDNPNEQEAVGLDLVEGDILDLLVIQSVIGDGDTSSRVS